MQPERPISMRWAEQPKAPTKHMSNFMDNVYLMWTG
jgi:hypothetical protein